jgi:hypothetical protein
MGNLIAPGRPASELVLVPVVDGVDVEHGQEPFDEGGRGVGDDAAEGGHLVQQRGVIVRFVGGCFQRGQVGGAG